MNDNQGQTASHLSYTPPVSRLLEIGNPNEVPNLDWPETDYLARYGLSSQDIPELIRMVADKALYDMDVETSETWAPIYAWRALGQLKAVEAVPALLALFPRVDDDDEWVLEEVPQIFESIGPAAIGPLAAYLADPGNLVWARIPAVNSLKRIGTRYPESRAECVAALTAVLERYPETDPILNASIALALADLNAVEAAPLVEQAFKADRVDEDLNGGWKQWQIDAGLLPDDSTSFAEDMFRKTRGEELLFPPTSVKKHAEDDKKKKKKNKQARQARKRNRGKK